MIFADTNPVELSYSKTVPFLISANLGDVAVEKKLENGNWVAVDGSPVPDGKTLRIQDHTEGGMIRFTPTATGTILKFSRIAE